MTLAAASAGAQPSPTTPVYVPMSGPPASTAFAYPSTAPDRPTDSPPDSAPRSPPPATAAPSVIVELPSGLVPGSTPNYRPEAVASSSSSGGGMAPGALAALLAFFALGLGLLATLAQFLLARRRVDVEVGTVSRRLTVTVGLSLLAAVALSGVQSPALGIALGALSVAVGVLIGRGER